MMRYGLLAFIMGAAVVTAQQSLGSFVRREATVGEFAGNYTFEFMLSDPSDNVGVDQVLGIAFGNDVVNPAASKYAPVSPFEYIQRNFIQVRFNKDQLGNGSLQLEVNQAGGQLQYTSVDLTAGGTNSL